MAEMADRARWHRTFALMATIGNILNREKVNPLRFFPWGKAETTKHKLPEPTAEQREELRQRYSGTK